MPHEAARPTQHHGGTWTPAQLERQAVVEAGGTVLANLSSGADDALIAWAKERDLFRSIGRSTRWANPYLLGEDGDRDEVCAWYAEYFARKRSLHRHLRELRGKVLGCVCHPERCHGETLITALARLAPDRGRAAPGDGER